uniref:Uncharacterized protein n=1 Tax=Anguilla anguilla TaxID=7936 RepID=A0A0E9TVU7_ANGAN
MQPKTARNTIAVQHENA